MQAKLRIESNSVRIFFQFLLLACIAALITLPLASNVFVPANIDYIVHLASIIQAKIALTDGQFPLRIAPTDHNGWPYPLFQFYSTSGYTIAGFIHQWLTPNNPLIAYKLTVWGAMLFGGIYMQRLAYWFVNSRTAALLASVVYLTAPYTILLINQIGAFNEVIALGILPAVIYYTLQYYSKATNIKTFLLTVLAWYLLATIHLITFLCTSLFVFLLLLFMSNKNCKNWLQFIHVGIAYSFSWLLAMWYLGPIMLFAKYFLANRTFNDANFFYAHTPSLLDLLSPITTKYGGLTTSEGFIDLISQIHPNIGIPIVFGVGICLYARYNAEKDLWLNVYIALFFIALFLCWSPINFWQWLPQSFMVLQYSWRLLAQLTWLGALLFAWSICWLFNNKFNYRNTFIILFLILASTSTLLIPSTHTYVNFSAAINALNKSDFYLIDAAKYPKFINMIDNKLLDPTNPLHPIGFLSDKNILHVEQVESHCKQSKELTICNLNIPNTIKLVELPIFYYPQLLNITLNDEPVSYISLFNKTNLITAIIPKPGQINNIKIQFRGLLWANYLSLTAWLTWALFFIFIVLQRFFYKSADSL